MTRSSPPFVDLRAAAHRALGIVLGLALAFTLFAGVARAEPAMWTVRDEDSVIHLFGTVHMLRPETEWRTPELDAALAASDALWLEIAEVESPQNQALMAEVIARYGTDPAYRLSEALSFGERRSLGKALAAIGAEPRSMETFKPWYASLILSTAPVLRAGYAPGSGAERVLSETARRSGATIEGFETIEQQLRFFADLPEAVQLDLLRRTLEEYEGATDLLDGMVDAWSEGDLETLETLLIEEMRAETPEIYEVLIVRRNQAWADTIKTLLEGSGTVFVAVGAGHLVGPDSVQAALARRGIAAVRAGEEAAPAAAAAE